MLEFQSYTQSEWAVIKWAGEPLARKSSQSKIRNVVLFTNIQDQICLGSETPVYAIYMFMP